MRFSSTGPQGGMLCQSFLCSWLRAPRELCGWDKWGQWVRLHSHAKALQTRVSTPGGRGRSDAAKRANECCARDRANVSRWDLVSSVRSSGCFVFGSRHRTHRAVLSWPCGFFSNRGSVPGTLSLPFGGNAGRIGNVPNLVGRRANSKRFFQRRRSTRHRTIPARSARRATGAKPAPTKRAVTALA